MTMEIVWVFLGGICLGFLVSVAYRDLVDVAKYRYNSRVKSIRDMEDRLDEWIQAVEDSNNKSWKSIHSLTHGLEELSKRVDVLVDMLVDKGWEE